MSQPNPKPDRLLEVTAAGRQLYALGQELTRYAHTEEELAGLLPRIACAYAVLANLHNLDGPAYRALQLRDEQKAAQVRQALRHEPVALPSSRSLRSTPHVVVAKGASRKHKAAARKLGKQVARGLSRDAGILAALQAREEFDRENMNPVMLVDANVGCPRAYWAPQPKAVRL